MGILWGRAWRGRGKQGQGFSVCKAESFKDKPTWRGERAHLPSFPGMQAFGNILNLVPLAESVVKLTAVCMECFRDAAYTKRLGLEKEVAAPPAAFREGGGGPEVLCPLSPGPVWGSPGPGGGDWRS